MGHGFRHLVGISAFAPSSVYYRSSGNLEVLGLWSVSQLDKVILKNQAEGIVSVLCVPREVSFLFLTVSN